MLDKDNAFQEAMVGSAIGSITQLNMTNLLLIKAFIDSQLEFKQQNKEEEKEESQDSPFIIIMAFLLSTQIDKMIREKKAQKRELSAEIHRLQEIRDDMRLEEINGDI